MLRVVFTRRALGASFAAFTLALTMFASASLGAGPLPNGRAPVDDWTLYAESFDARALAADEKLMIQVGLALSGHYTALLDGAWGGGSHRALTAWAREQSILNAEGEPVLAHAATVATAAIMFASERDIGWRRIGPFDAWALIAPGPDARRVDNSQYHEMHAGSVGFMAGLETQVFMHKWHTDAQTPDAYALRRPDRYVTSKTIDGATVYERSEPYGPGQWLSISVHSDAEDPLGRLAIASLRFVDPPGDFEISNDGLLASAIYTLIEKEKLGETEPAPADAGPEVASLEPPIADGGAVDPKAAADVVSSGTAFFVNNTDLVTAAHVVDGCARLASPDGSRLWEIARHPTLDLAILSGERRSRAWLGVGRAPARLGQAVYALGFPFWGVASTGLHLTAGNVSAERGLGDKDGEITISAAVQPGNSGGPLLDRSGAVAGVVISRLSAKAMLQTVGALPENMNFAVRSEALAEFLDAHGVLHHQPRPLAVDIDDGISDEISDAVVAILCYAE